MARLSPLPDGQPDRAQLAAGAACRWSKARRSQGPLALGVLDRRIVVPGRFLQRYNPGERRLALEHELVHHRRGDIWWNLAALLVLALNWFNPVAWLAFRAFRSDQELACDAAVARAAPIRRRATIMRVPWSNPRAGPA